MKITKQLIADLEKALDTRKKDGTPIWDDMDKLNTLYEELCWDHTDYLEFAIEGNHITIRNKSREGR